MEKNDIDFTQSAVLDVSTSTLTFEQALIGEYCIIDVRSPKEFSEGSLPAAINIPIFDNDERKLIGTVYRYAGREEAISTGFGVMGKRLAEFILNFEPYKEKRIALFCARGGMRSRSVVNLLNQNGFTAWQLEGGYKQYRHVLLEVFEQFRPRCIVIHGHTGTGKTRILQHLQHMIDLEDLAQHQSSLFGGMNRNPRAQKTFDSYLHQAICRLGPEPYFIEGESRKMGAVYLPTRLAESMKSGHLVLVTASIETRVARILEDYPVEDDATVQLVLGILENLRSKLGHVITDKLGALLKAGALDELVHILLVDYYDKRYDNSLKRYTYSLEVSSEDIVNAAEILTDYRESLIV